MISQRWRKQYLLMFLVGLVTYQSVFASNTTIREIVLRGKNTVEIQFDSPIEKRALELDFVRDIAQISVQGASIYPAKIIHSEGQTFNKVFAYQYAPNLVRIRFTVSGVAGQYQGRVLTQIQGDRLKIQFPEVAGASSKEKGTEKGADHNAVKNTDKNVEEKSLLAKVLANTEPAEGRASKPTDRTNEKVADRPADKGSERSTERNLTGKKNSPSAIGGKQEGSSPFRSFMMMFLVVGGLGVVLFFVKRKRNQVQARRVGEGWWNQIIPAGMRKQKSFIEVVAQHALGPKQSITVVKIRGQQFVLAVSQDSVQLLTQLDADETEVDVLEDPAVAASLGKMFGSAPVKSEPTKSESVKSTPPLSSIFDQVLKSSTGATAVIGRQQYTQQSQTPAHSLARAPSQSLASSALPTSNSVRDQIRRRLEGVRL